MKTIITPPYNRQRTLRRLAKENGGKLVNVQVPSFSIALQEENEDTSFVTLKIQKLLQEHIDEFPIYGKMFCFPAFLQEVITFAKKCVLYGIEAEDLPEKTENELELKKLLSYVLTYPFVERNNVRKASVILEQLKMEDVEIEPLFLSDPYHYRLLEQLKTKKPYLSNKTNPKTTLKRALNSRQELEAIAQDIIANDEPCNVILCDPKNQYPLLEQIFLRYGIPYSTTCGTTSIQVPYMFSSLVKYALKKDADSFLNIAKHHAFSTPCPSEVLPFLFQIYTEGGLSDIPINALPPQQAGKTISLLKKITNWLETIEEEKQTLFQCSTPKDALVSSYNILRKNNILSSPKEQSTAFNIYKTLNDCLPLIESNEDAFALLDMLESVSISYTKDRTDFCIVTSLQKPVPTTFNSYVVGCCGTNYPGYQAESGLFDETYVRSINKFPSAEERYNQHMVQMEWIEHSATNRILYSYATNDYEGKDISPAFQIEMVLGEGELWKPKTLKPNTKKEHVLKKETAKAIFTRNIEVKEKTKSDVVSGSISSIEKYFKCPYSYFISSGLFLRKDQSLGLDTASIGTIQHAILEQGVKKYGKDISKLTDEEIASLIEPSFQAMDALTPTNKENHKLTKERMVHSVHNAILFLSEYEKYNAYKPLEQEKKFANYPISEHVYLNGTIDRVDRNHKEVRIMDYKSSEHSLSETSIKAGLQLQLLSYLMVACDVFEAAPGGAYYFSLKDENIDSPAAKVGMTGFDPIAFPKEKEESALIQSKQLKGWTYTKNITALDESEKQKFIVALKTEHDFEATKQCVHDLYEYFYHSLLSGDIKVSPINGNQQGGACVYCDYKSVCRYHGEAVEAKQLVDYELTIRKSEKKEGGKK